MAEKTVVIGGAEYTFRTPDGVAFIEEAELIDPNLKAPDARSLINKAARAESEHLLRLEFLRKTGDTADRSPRSFAKFAARERGEAPSRRTPRRAHDPLPERGSEGREHLAPSKTLKRPDAPDITGVTAPKSARKSAALKALKKLGPKALGIGMLGKLASLPGVAEAAEVVGRDERSLQRFFQDYESMLGMSPAREEFPVFELDEERRRAASAQMRSGRTGLRPGFDEPPITEEEEIFVRSAPRPRRRK